MHLVDRHRLRVGVAPSTALHPCLVTPRIAVKIGDHAGGAQVVLRIESKRISLEEDIALGSADLELVVIPLVHAGDEDLPDT